MDSDIRAAIIEELRLNNVDPRSWATIKAIDALQRDRVEIEALYASNEGYRKTIQQYVTDVQALQRELAVAQELLAMSRGHVDTLLKERDAALADLADAKERIADLRDKDG